MKKFKYRLSPLLKIKEHLEKEKQKEHALAQQQVVDQEEVLATVDRNRFSTMDYQRDALHGRLTLTQLQSCSRYLTQLKKDTLAGMQLLKAYEKEAERRRQILVEASKQRKIYEKLKEKQQDKFNKEMHDHERKELDEIATTNYRRNSGK